MWNSISYYGALALESVLGVFGVRLYEEPRYDVIQRVADRVEIRRYGILRRSRSSVGHSGRSWEE